MSVVDLHPAYMLQDLATSGLSPEDVRARIAGPNEKQATNTPQGAEAYVLPYFDISGKAIPFYRTKIINGEPKYKQLATSSNHVYFPRGFSALLPNADFILITEGEKKAAAAVKAGFPCVALGGVDSWKNRTVIFHKDSQIGQTSSGQIVAKLPAGAEMTEKVDTLASGLQEIINIILKEKIPLVMCFDLDFKPGRPSGVSYEAQRACATLGYELRFRGVPFQNIRQLILDRKDTETPKLGLDDFLIHKELGPEEFKRQLDACLAKPSAFPQHPSPREYVNKKLQKPHMMRSEMQALSTSIICDMDAKGTRLRCPDDDTYYYFCKKEHKLYPVRWSESLNFSMTSFGIKMYNDYTLTMGDKRLFAQLTAQFAAEEPIKAVRPERVMTIKGDNLYYQISDGHMIRVNADSITVLNNGSDNVLFESGHVKEVDTQKLVRHINELLGQDSLQSLWYETMKDVRLTESKNDYTRKLLSLLYNISPWFYRWRNTQLPVEMVVGEAGSGKSTLFSLRLGVLQGVASLRNAPSDMRDWTASVASTGGLHVTDNVHLTNAKLKQELSDELCRIVTESDPHIERRKLYSDNDLVRTAVSSVFAFTAIQQPFTNQDIIQRSIIVSLDKGTEEVSYDTDWLGHQLAKFGGREYWIAHQLVFQQKMFQEIKKRWVQRYNAKFRLVNVEQLLMMAAELYGWESEWIPGYLEGMRDSRIKGSDQALQGLIAWASLIRSQNGARTPQILFTVGNIVEWAEGEEEYDKNRVLTNGRSLGTYIQQHKNTIANIVGLIPLEGRKVNNRQAFQVLLPKVESTAAKANAGTDSTNSTE